MRLKLGQYELWVVVEGEEVEHYATEVDEEAKRATSWVASTAGKHFGISTMKNHTDFDCAVTLYLDGTYATGAFLIKGFIQSKCMDSVVHSSSRQPFMFGTIDLTDDESHLDDIASCEHLGELKIIINRVIFPTIVKTRPVTDIPRGEVGRIHEQAKKSLTHQVTFGEAREVKTPNQSVAVDCKEVVATFIIHYRSFDMLKAMGIAPRDPTPEKDAAASSQASSHFIPGLVSSTLGKRKILEVKDEDEDENPSVDAENKILDLERELAQLKESLVHNRGKKKIKQEPRPPFRPGEVIDLT